MKGCSPQRLHLGLLRAVHTIAKKYCKGDIGKLVEHFRREGYRSRAWQCMKREIAEALVPCILEMLNCNVEAIYYADLHGAEPAALEDVGGKDIDFIIKVPRSSSVESSDIEEALESLVVRELSKMLGEDVRKLVGIPNVVEIHVVRDFREDRMGFSASSYFAPAILIWSKGSDCNV